MIQTAFLVRVAIALFLLLVIFSYSEQDPSPFLWSYPPKEPSNLVGAIGADISSYFFYFFGEAAYVVWWPITEFFVLLLFPADPRRWYRSAASAVCFVYFVIGWEVMTRIAAGFLTPIDIGGGHFGTFMVQQAIGFSRACWFVGLAPLFALVMMKRAQLFSVASKTGCLSHIFRLFNSPAPKRSGDLDGESAYTVGAFRFSCSLDPGGFRKASKDCRETEKLINDTLNSYGVKGKVTDHVRGPSITVYYFSLAGGVKIAKVIGLADELALALGCASVVMEPEPKRRSIGIQVANNHRWPVLLGDLLEEACFRVSKSPLEFAVGKRSDGSSVFCDLAKMPHLLIAGQTGSGKSVGINAMICSILSRVSSDDVKFVMVDPKVIELKAYEKIPHLAMPVITEPEDAAAAMFWLVDEMERRYRVFEDKGVRCLDDYQKVVVSKPRSSRMVPIVVIIDELADLILGPNKDIETYIQRLAQKARASGIHLVLATQRPSVDVITGVIKANLPCRMAFQVFSRVDSRTILDRIGAEKLLGKGDLFLLQPGAERLERIQGCFVSNEEVRAFVDQLASEAVGHSPNILEEIRLAYKNKVNNLTARKNEVQSSSSLSANNSRHGFGY